MRPVGDIFTFPFRSSSSVCMCVCEVLEEEEYLSFDLEDEENLKKSLKDVKINVFKNMLVDLPWRSSESRTAHT
jgi:hypothetical protein